MSQIVHTPAAPAAIGPYSQAMVHNGLVYTSGQIALVPGGASLVGETAADQCEVVMGNLSAVLHAAGSSLHQVLKTTIFLLDMADFAEVNAVYARHMGDHRPARATVAVAALPRGARVEIDCIAVVA